MERHAVEEDLHGEGPQVEVGRDDHPEARALLAEGLTVAATAVEELLRLGPPDQATQGIPRVAVDVGRHVVPAGSFAVVVSAAATRDPAVFADPDRLDLRRGPNPHLAFGLGATTASGRRWPGWRPARRCRR